MGAVKPYSDESAFIDHIKLQLTQVAKLKGNKLGCAQKGTPLIKMTGCFQEILVTIRKSYQNVLLCVCLKFIFTPMRYQF